MFRRRLKSRTGCLTCKTRHKKCGEEKPSCSECLRLGLRCRYLVAQESWQDSRDELKPRLDEEVFPHQISRIAATKSLVKGATNGYQVFSSQVEFDLIMTTPFLIQSTTNQPCGTQSRDFSCLTSAALWVPWLRPTFYAYAATMLSVKTTEDNLLTLQHYHKSINELRLRLSTDIRTDDLFPILVSTCILGTLEVHGFARPAFALAHYFACMQLLQKVPSERIFNAGSTLRSFYRTVAETSLHGIANLSLFHQAPRKLFALIDWKFLSQVLESPYHQCRRPLELKSQFLAELPSFNNLQRLLLILIVICREPNPSESHHDQLRLIDQELDTLESQLPLFYGADVREDITRAFGFRWRAVMYALRILVEKLSKPWICSATPTVRHNLQLCIVNIVKLNTSLRSRPEIAWPPPYSNHGLGSNQNITMHWFYLVILAAAHTLEEMNFAIPFLSKPKIWGDLNHFQKIQNFIDAVRVSRCKPEKMTCDGISNVLHHHVHDGLDILVSIDGPLVAKDETMATASDIRDS